MTTYADAFAEQMPEYTLAETGEHLDARVINAKVAELDAVDNGTFAETLHGKHNQAVAFYAAPTPLYHQIAHEVGMDWSPDETRERHDRIDAEFRELAACDHETAMASDLRQMADEVDELAGAGESR